MKKLVLVFVLIPFLCFSQTKNVLSTERIFPKVDKVAEFEKAFANHAQKYHTGLWKWRVYEIQSGPDFGGYMLVEGPNSWEDFGNRGDLGAEHTNDWNKNIAPLIMQDGQSHYMEYREDLSSVPLSEYSKWITINHLFYNPGFFGDMMTLVGKMKPVWTAGNESIAVYTANASGAPQFTLVSRYKTGLKEKDMNFRPDSFKERFEKVHSAAAFTDWVTMVQKAVNKQWSELLMYREDLSSK